MSWWSRWFSPPPAEDRPQTPLPEALQGSPHKLSQQLLDKARPLAERQAMLRQVAAGDPEVLGQVLSRVVMAQEDALAAEALRVGRERRPPNWEGLLMVLALPPRPMAQDAWMDALNALRTPEADALLVELVQGGPPRVKGYAQRLLKERPEGEKPSGRLAVVQGGGALSVVKKDNP